MVGWLRGSVRTRLGQKERGVGGSPPGRPTHQVVAVLEHATEGLHAGGFQVLWVHALLLRLHPCLRTKRRKRKGFSLRKGLAFATGVWELDDDDSLRIYVCPCSSSRRAPPPNFPPVRPGSGTCNSPRKGASWRSRARPAAGLRFASLLKPLAAALLAPSSVPWSFFD